jgi:type II secretory pathway pseudopilin PulG
MFRFLMRFQLASDKEQSKATGMNGLQAAAAWNPAGGKWLLPAESKNEVQNQLPPTGAQWNPPGDHWISPANGTAPNENRTSANGIRMIRHQFLWFLERLAIGMVYAVKKTEETNP